MSVGDTLSAPSSRFAFTDAERIPLVRNGALGVDAESREVLLGLTHDETAVVVKYQRLFLSGKPDRGNEARYVALCNRHELAMHPHKQRPSRRPPRYDDQTRVVTG